MSVGYCLGEWVYVQDSGRKKQSLFENSLFSLLSFVFLKLSLELGDSSVSSNCLAFGQQGYGQSVSLPGLGSTSRNHSWGQMGP